jgi:hypothetical protein
VKGNSYGDWISYLLVLALSNFPSVAIDIPLWTRTISLFLTGALIASSLAQVLRSVGKIVHLTSKTAGASFLLLALGQLFVRVAPGPQLNAVRLCCLPTHPNANFAIVGRIGKSAWFVARFSNVWAPVRHCLRRCGGEHIHIQIHFAQGGLRYPYCFSDMALNRVHNFLGQSLGAMVIVEHLL